MEKFWFFAVFILSLAIWAALTISIVGLVYAIGLGIFLLFTQAVWVCHIRGSAVRLGAQQIPQLYQRVAALAEKLKLKKVPEVYLCQSNGVVNAMASRFFLTDFMILNSDIVEACGDNPDALDFVVGHELGHIRRGHLKWMWFLAPGRILPFVGQAYSRGRELTCDRYGYALSINKARALEGLCILAGGAKYAHEINRQAFVDQTKELGGFWMRVGKWLSAYPPLAGRLAALDTGVEKPKTRNVTGLVLASLFAVLVYAILGGIVGGYALAIKEMVSAAGKVKTLEQENDKLEGLAIPPPDQPSFSVK
jgi:Zn-dependent protease with chaperone function